MSVDNDEVPDTPTIKKVAERVRVRREQLDLDQDLARYGGPSRSTVSILENKGSWPLRQRTRAAWSTALRWEPDAFERLANGEEPVELDTTVTPLPVEEEIDPLRAWLRDEIEEVVRTETEALRREVERLERLVQDRRGSASRPSRSSDSPARRASTDRRAR